MSNRIVCQFSCGAASAVATKLALAEYGATHDVQIINAFLANEHDDNRRFAQDCEIWFGQPITVLRDEKYGADVQNVFLRERYMKGPHGAPCSTLLKRRLLSTYDRPGDVMVFGYTAEETDRLDDFRERNPDRPVIAPLIDRGLGKEDCKAIIERAGIELPAMYRIGYYNANCIACPKGGEGYWRAIREDFPEVFEQRCLVQDELGPGSWFLRYRSGPRKDERFPLRDLPVGPIARNEKLPSCSFFCEMAEADIAATA
jgi:3'-phosphoadenosine 5'-phosphosulfate sulfotransferase (PAPS reductase)/FAD synthetase